MCISVVSFLGTKMSQAAVPRLFSPAGFAEKQGQCPAFIHTYTKINGRPPAEADMQRHFRITRQPYIRWS